MRDLLEGPQSATHRSYLREVGDRGRAFHKSLERRAIEVDEAPVV